MGIFGNKKRGFTVAEMAVAVAIIGLLAALLIPMAVSQFKRGDEYYYFMTYKTLEKISGQIVNVPTIEDYEEESASISPKDDSRIVYETPKDGLNDALYSFKDIIADILNAPAYAEDAYDLNSDTGIVYSYPLSSYPEMLELIGYECVCHQRCFADALNVWVAAIDAQNSKVNLWLIFLMLRQEIHIIMKLVLTLILMM